VNHHPDTPPHGLGDDRGFTLVEVLFTMLILVLGVFATITLLDNSNKATASTLQRDSGNSLAREIVERTNGMAYASLTATNAADQLRQAADPTGSQSSASTGANTFTIRRRNTTYTVTYSACTRTDAVNGITILDPTDCDYAKTPDPPATPGGSNGPCKVGVLNQSNFTPGSVAVYLKVLSGVQLSTCLSDGGAGLTSAVCGILGQSPGFRAILDSLTGREGILNVLGGSLGVGIGAGVCGGTTSLDPTAGLSVPDVRGSSTATTVKVTWVQGDRTNTISQTGLIQRTPPGTGV
jgi:Tfp pilus assembly protein PilV